MASEREQPTSNDKNSQAESENLNEPAQNTDDYFESVNRRLKKKSRFGLGKPKKEAAPKKKQSPPKKSKIETPETPVPLEETKVEEIKTEEKVEPVTETQTPVEEVIEQQPVTVEPETLTVKEPIETQPVEGEELQKIELINDQPAKDNESDLNKIEKDLPEIEIITVPPPQDITPDIQHSTEGELKIKDKAEVQIKPKPEKKGFLSFLNYFRKQDNKRPRNTQVKLTDKQLEKMTNEDNKRPLIAETFSSNIKDTSLFSSSEKLEKPIDEETSTNSKFFLVCNPDPTKEIISEPKEKTGSDTINKTLQLSQEQEIDSAVRSLVLNTNNVQKIGRYPKDWTTLFPRKAVLSIGEYPVHLLLKSRFASRPDGILPLFIDKSSQDIIKEGKNQIDPEHVIGLDTELDAHFWYNISPNVTKDSPFLAQLESKPVSQLQKALIVASIWDGVGSALLPTIAAEFEERKINSAALALFPSKVQSVESQFNAFAAVGKCAISGAAPIVLLDRDSIENYLGVDRKGNMIKGNTVINYLVDLMLSRDTFADEFSELSKTFDSPIFTLMFGTGASLRVYGSIENILDTLLFKQFLSFDLSSSELLYVLTRVPYSLKDKVPRGKIEMAAANWFKDKATLKSIHVAEPVYVEENSDRIDIALFVGGFNTTKIFSAMEKKVNTMKNRAVKKGFLQEDEWKEIVKKLTS